MELNNVSKLLLDEVAKTRPARVVFDSLSEFRLLAETPLRYRRQLLNLKQHFAHYESTGPENWYTSDPPNAARAPIPSRL